ncbi:MAG: NUDIX hydrolase [Oscillospiraceae bacterium]
MELDYKEDCCITTDKNWFRYRAAAIIIENGCVLLASNETSDYYYSVGGGVHFGEAAEEAVVREVLEETGVKYEVDRLAFIHENFFMGDGATKDLKCHEIAFYFLMKTRGSQELNSNSVCADGKEYMNWIPIDELKRYNQYPKFFAEKLKNLPNYIEHIVTSEL